MQTLFTWWHGRSERERWLLAVLGALLAITLVWLAIIRPLAVAAELGRQRLADRTAELQSVRAAASELASATGAPHPPRDGRPVRDVVAAAAASAGLEFASTQPEENGGVLVSIAAVKPTFLFGWIAALEAAEGVVADRVSVERNSDATVSAEVGFPGRRS